MLVALVCVMIHYRIEPIIILALIVCISMLAVSMLIMRDVSIDSEKSRIDELSIITSEIELKQREHERRLSKLEDM